MIEHDISGLIDEQAEYLILASLIYYVDSTSADFQAIMDELDSSVFAASLSRELYEIIKALYDNGKVVSMVEVGYQASIEVYEYIKGIEKPELNTISYLLTVVAELKRKQRQRACVKELSHICNELVVSKGEKVSEILDSIPDRVNKALAIESDTGDMHTIQQCVDSYIAQRNSGISRIKTGMQDLDNNLGGGFRNAQVVVFGASPSTGKTIFSLKVLLGIQKQNTARRAVIFSLEAEKEDVLSILASHYYNEDFDKFSLYQVEQSAKILSNLNIEICDKPGINTAFMRKKCKAASQKCPLSVIFVDYLDLVRPSTNKTRHDLDLESITNDLKAMAKEFNCLVILLTQLNKEASKREDKRPRASDSKNTSSTEQVATYWFGLNQIGRWYPGEVHADSDIFEVILDKGRYDKPFIAFYRKDGRLFHEIHQELAQELVAQGNEGRKNKYQPERKEKSISQMFTRKDSSR